MNDGATGRGLVVQRRFPGISASELLRYWTEPSLLVRWWPQEAEVDLRVGGRLHLAWPAANWHLRGEIFEYREGEVLSFTWAWDHLADEPQREVRIEVHTADHDTVLTLEQGPYGTSAAERQAREGHAEGWAHFLARLEATVASR